MDNMTDLPVHTIQLMDSYNHEVYYKDLRMLFLPLTNAKKKWEDCTNDKERVLYLLNNMQDMDKTSKPYEDDFFNELFNAAYLTAEDAVPYSQSLQRLKDIEIEKRLIAEDVERIAKKKYLAEGRAEGEAKGRAEGEAKGISIGKHKNAIATARKLLERRFPVKMICEVTSLSETEVLKLTN